MHPAAPRRPRFAAFAVAVVLALGSGLLAVTLTSPAEAATVGAGSYTETLPTGAGPASLIVKPCDGTTAGNPEQPWQVRASQQFIRLRGF